MPSQFFGLNIAYSGLLASNAALNTTSNNIANVQTKGYSRQQVVQQAANAIRVFETYGCAGAGVETLAVERIRNEFYDGKYWNNQTDYGEYAVKQTYMEQIETYYTDDGVSGFGSVFDNLMTAALEALMKDPSGNAARTQFIGYAGSLAEYFNGVSGNMKALQKDLNDEIKLKVDTITSLASEIAALNQQINVIELAVGTANELRDRRSVLLDELSQIVDVQVEETPVVDSNNPSRETGATRFLVKIAGGQILVDAGEYNGLSCAARASYEKTNQTDIDGLYDVYWDDGQKFNLYNGAMGGELQGLIQLRDGNNGTGFSGQITGTGQTADGSHDTVTVEVTKDYLQDLNKCSLSDKGGIILLGNQEFYYDSWEYSRTYDANGDPVCRYTFTLSGSPLNERGVTNDRAGKTAKVGTSLDYQGVPYYMSQMNEWIRTFSQKFNDILNSGYDLYGDPAADLFTGNMAAQDGQFGFAGDKAYLADLERKKQELMAADPSWTAEQALEQAKKEVEFRVSSADDSYWRLTADNFAVSAALENDGGLLGTRLNADDGVEQSDLLQSLRAMVTDKSQMSFRGCNASEFLQCVLSDVTLNASRANTLYSTYSNLRDTIENQRISVSGVDEDEEAVSLVKYQNGYNLASRMVQTMSEIYDRLILETGV
ncbi:MAG: flagellar hook-associated protein FlgK [Clostridium sp.]|jgi:flagellar hook-associated protein 1 FlgK|nr:flagellar hook-associated protein FlgK [Clostridium sp.]